MSDVHPQSTKKNKEPDADHVEWMVRRLGIDCAPEWLPEITGALHRALELVDMFSTFPLAGEYNLHPVFEP